MSRECEMLCVKIKYTIGCTICQNNICGVDQNKRQTLQHTATRCNTLQHTATHCNALQYTATHCNTLQHSTIRGVVAQICVAVCCSVLHSVLQCVVVCCSVCLTNSSWGTPHVSRTHMRSANFLSYRVSHGCHNLCYFVQSLFHTSRKYTLRFSVLHLECHFFLFPNLD